MNFDTYFRLASYATVAAAALALYVAGGIEAWLGVAFGLFLFAAWKLEDSRWQLTERIALIAILVSLPIFYFDWRVFTPYLQFEFLETGRRGNVEVTVLAHLIVFLSAVKLLQRKGDRDWFFLYLISFFTVLLAAGLTASPLFLAALIVYLLCALSTVVAFEIQKSRKKVTAIQTRLLVPPDSTLFRKLPMRLWRRRYLETRRLPLISIALLIFIVILALPFFLIAPRSASSALRRGGNGVAGFIGFSDSVTLGQIGQLKGSDEIFMHVRVENPASASPMSLRWRGVALDEFTGKGWKKSAAAQRIERRESDRGFFQLGTTVDLARLTTQTFFLEPVDTPVLFGAPRIVAVQGKLPFLQVDSENAVQTRPHDQERLTYKIYSDTTEPSANALRSDRLQYFVESARYLELPANLDPRIGELERGVIQRSGARNWYDAARATETYLRESYGYTLDLKAAGPDPLADFLFNVKVGHCEYFASAMAIMLRTQGVATRIVNGFLPGEYNEAAGAFTVRQSDAHSWVEVYFPETRAWVTFDPTPPAGREAKVRTGLAGYLSKYTEALQLMWFQYGVGYDKQEQRSLLTAVRRELFDFRRASATKFDQARASIPQLITPGAVILGSVFLLAAALIIARRVYRVGWRRGLIIWRPVAASESSRVDFYERFIKLLEKKGWRRESHQTPLEFADSIGWPEAAIVTNAYNRVRFGAEELSSNEARQLEQTLAEIKEGSAR